MAEMRALMERIQKSSDPAERQRLLDEHARLMQQGMMMMGQMMHGPGGQDPQCAQNDTPCQMQRMQGQQQMMGQQMGMMQSMMQQMMGQMMGMMQQGAKPDAKPGDKDQQDHEEPSQTAGGKGRALSFLLLLRHCARLRRRDARLLWRYKRLRPPRPWRRHQRRLVFGLVGELKIRLLPYIVVDRVEIFLIEVLLQLGVCGFFDRRISPNYRREWIARGAGGSRRLGCRGTNAVRFIERVAKVCFLSLPRRSPLRVHRRVLWRSRLE